MEQDPIQNDARRARRQRRIGAPTVCMLCGLRELAALTVLPRRLIEQHHVVGRAHDPQLMVPVCRNCHAILTERYRHAGVSMRPPASALDRLVAALGALGVFFRELAAACVRWAAELSELVEALDAACPRWRKVKGGR